MSSTVTLDPASSAFVEAEVASGRFHSASDVIVHALKLVRDRARHEAELDAALEKGIADVEAGRDYDLDEVFDELEARYASAEAFSRP